MNSVAMDPMGEVAGTAAAIVGAMSAAGGAVLGTLIDRAYDGTIMPLALGFMASSVVALVGRGPNGQGLWHVTDSLRVFHHGPPPRSRCAAP